MKKESVTGTSVKVKQYVGSRAGVDTEENYYNNSPVELSSILAKVLADVIMACGVAEIPIELMKLV